MVPLVLLLLNPHIRKTFHLDLLLILKNLHPHLLIILKTQKNLHPHIWKVHKIFHLHLLLVLKKQKNLHPHIHKRHQIFHPHHHAHHLLVLLLLLLMKQQNLHPQTEGLLVPARKNKRGRSVEEGSSLAQEGDAQQNYVPPYGGIPTPPSYYRGAPMQA
jgi:hypothetical protein